jgi:mono/diheme cytochrome c family protein
VTIRGAGLALAATLAVAGCGESTPPSDPLAGRGRQVYVAQCTQCHATDPAQTGPVGPPVRGASSALLEAKVIRGDYPSGYAPKRPTRVMPPMPTLAPDLAALAAYLR